ncbi:MAG: type II 3-dehydroquinate dehydratase [Fimbriimonadales bacterium]
MAETKRVLVLHGPNLNLTGFRETSVYGSRPLEDIDADIMKRAEQLKIEARIMQSNHEGQLIDAIHEHKSWATGIIVNAGGLSHYSVSLRDALTAVRLPVIEVHLSNIFAREEFRANSVISGVSMGVVTGFGGMGYLMALDAMNAILVSNV